MAPVPEWQTFLKKAWSVRLHATSVLLCSAGSALMLLNPEVTGHPFLVAASMFLLSAAGGLLGIVAQITQQKDLPNA